MCLLVVVRGRFASHPILVAANRDERLDRRSAPPGLWVGRRRRVISPRDRQAGGTWLGVNDRGAFAGLTNLAGVPVPAGASSRGELVHLALDEDDLEAGARAVDARCAQAPFGGFQLALCDGARTVVLRHAGRGPEGVDWRIDWQPDVLVISNLHGPGELELRGLAQALAPAADAAQQLERLRPLLLDRGEHDGHPVLKRGDEYGTVSSSLIAVPAQDPRALIWRYAAGPPDTTEYRNYGNLGRRLLPDGEPLPPDRPADS
jgi:uncharacterized protein with NRDE domain